VNDMNELSTWFSDHWPKGPLEVAMFTQRAAEALGVYEADLAAKLGVGRAALSGWKKRGVIPETHLEWFTSEFVKSVLFSSNRVIDDRAEHSGVEYALALLASTDFNPFSLSGIERPDLLRIATGFFPGLVRLSRFVGLMTQFEFTLNHQDHVAKIASMLVRLSTPTVLPGSPHSY